MAEDSNELINNLVEKINQLKELYHKQKAENLKLENKNKNLHDELEAMARKNKELRAEYDKLQTAHSLISGEDKENAKRKINSIVREIDKCVALLNR